MIPDQLKELYGLDPAKMPFALQFPRLPPGLLHPALGATRTREQFAMRARRTAPALIDYTEMYGKLASGLIDLDSRPMIPPSHPLFAGLDSSEALRAENAKLKMENLELRKELDGSKTAGAPPLRPSGPGGPARHA